MESVIIGPSIMAVVAWACSLNTIMAPAIAQKEGFNMPSIVYSGNFRLAGQIGLVISTILGYLAAGPWGIVLVPVAGMLLGGLSVAVLRETMLSFSVPLGVISSAACAVWLLWFI